MNKLPTWYVIEPRDRPCADVNPALWQEFERKHGSVPIDSRLLYTEAMCVQWLDLFYEKNGLSETPQEIAANG